MQIRARAKGESWAPVAVRSLLAPIGIFAPISEGFHRRARRDTAMSKIKPLNFTAKRMEKFIDHIAYTYPKYRRMCDFLKEEQKEKEEQ